MKPQLGVCGLGTMGMSLARNAARNGARVVVFNRTVQKTDEFLKKHGSEGEIVGARTLAEFVKALTPPRPILMIVKAGAPVDEVVAELAPLLARGDILIDAGNSHYRDTERREKELSAKGLHFFGMGVSGGEEGALWGPSMMPGGDEAAYRVLEPLFQKMAAKDGSGGMCVTHIGPGGSGHFVKMVHNGIEYGIMQLIAEVYDVLKSEGGMSNAELADLFTSWNAQGSNLQSFLVEITAEIFQKKDDMTGKDLVDLIKDEAAQKGTGKWTTDAAMGYGVTIPTITAAVDARILSGSADLRKTGAEFPEVRDQPYDNITPLSSLARTALELSVVCAYGQGFGLLSTASHDEGWKLQLREIARIWCGGCIIRSALLRTFQQSFSSDAALAKSGWEQLVAQFVGERQLEWRRFIAVAIGRGIPVPALSASLAYYDSIRRPRLPQNLVQAQRDFFGAHTYQRTDREGTFHTHWK